MTKGKTGAAIAAPSTQNKENPTATGPDLAQLKAELETVLAENKDLKEELAKLKMDNEVLTATNNNLQAAFDAATEELEDAAATLEELKAQLNPDVKSKGPVVEIGNNKYLITSGLRTKEKVFTADDIAADEALVKKLIDKGSTIPQLID
jgi:regulator of replication initiation timing